MKDALEAARILRVQEKGSGAYYEFDLDCYDVVFYALNRIEHGERAERYRKRPVTVRAARWTGKGTCPAWAQHAVEELEDRFRVTTLEGRMEGAFGDWIVEGVHGELYPVRHDIFVATYEQARQAACAKE